MLTRSPWFSTLGGLRGIRFATDAQARDRKFEKFMTYIYIFLIRHLEIVGILKIHLRMMLNDVKYNHCNIKAYFVLILAQRIPCLTIVETMNNI
jgi:hypothetical protein